jgi:hypothetical protein
VATAALLGSVAHARPDRAGPEVAIFYYGWWGTPARDGAWQHWSQAGAQPPLSVASAFFPARGLYSSTDPRVVLAQMREIQALGIDTVILSWWGPDSPEDARLPELAASARRAGLRIAAHLEPWPGRTAASTADGIVSLARMGFGDVYVYDSSAISDEDWAAALGALTDVRVFANTMLPGKARRAGFDGIYSYDVLVYDGRSFGRICRSANRLGLLCAPSVGPGFDARRASGITATASRRKGRRYDAMWSAALAARPDVVTITSYNEWHEGTQIEAARTGVPGFASYDGAYALRGKPAERAYLTRTAYWINRLRTLPPLS